MLRIILSGCSGTMGRAVTACVDEHDNCEIVAGVDINPVMFGHFPVFNSFKDIKAEADVIIDFSHPSNLSKLLEFAKTSSLPLVIATTGLSDKQIDEVKTAAKSLPLFFSFNMSLGVNLLLELSRKAAAILSNDFDIEIIEKHHNKKIDAPSGTAIMIANEINDVLDSKMTFEFDRHSQNTKRTKNEIGIHSVRGGTIVGEHEVIFAGRDELITISHSARSKEVFAVGALNAAHFIADKTPGLYNMKSLVDSK